MGIAQSAILSMETPTMKPCLPALVLFPAAALAQSASPATVSIEAKLAALEAATKSAQSAGDNAWMLMSAALVLMMTGPGLALFYGGFGQEKECAGRWPATAWCLPKACPSSEICVTCF